jgi:hypothetical protein
VTFIAASEWFIAVVMPPRVAIDGCREAMGDHGGKRDGLKSGPSSNIQPAAIGG